MLKRKKERKMANWRTDERLHVTFTVDYESWLVKNREGTLWTSAHDKEVVVVVL